MFNLEIRDGLEFVKSSVSVNKIIDCKILEETKLLDEMILLLNSQDGIFFVYPSNFNKINKRLDEIYLLVKELYKKDGFFIYKDYLITCSVTTEYGIANLEGLRFRKALSLS